MTSGRATESPLGHHALSGSGSDRYRLPLRGRAAEEHSIERGILSVLAGERALTMLSGEPGIGKTRLLQHAVELARVRGLPTLIVAPDIDSFTTPLGALMDAVTRTDPPLVPHQRLASVLWADAAQYWVTRMVADALEVAAGTVGYVVVVDDLQWLDAGSLGALDALIRDLQGLPVYWLLATRSGVYSCAHQRFMSKIAALAESVEIHPLDGDAVEAMTHDALGAAPGPGVQTAVRRAGGLPLIVLEMLRGLEEEGMLRRTRGTIDLEIDSIPTRFGESTRDRLRQVSHDALRITQLGSLYGREFPLAGVLDILGISATAAGPAVQELLDLGFITDTGITFAFRHDTVQSAAADTLSPTLRRAMAREVLARRLAAGDAVSGLAGTIASVAEGGEDDSIELLFQAADQLSGTDMQGAADLVVYGASLAAGRPVHAERVASLLPIVLAGGRTGEAVEIGRTWSPLLGPGSRARVALAMARQLTESDFAGALAETADALLIPGVPDETKVQLLAVRALNFANTADSTGLQDALATARAIADDERDGHALATLDATESVLLFYQGRFDAAQRLQRQATERIASTGVAAGLWLPEGLWMAFMRNSLGHCAEALELVDVGLSEAIEAKNIVAETYWRMVHTRVLYDAGRLDEARTQAEAVLDMASELGLGDFTNATAGIVLHRIALHTGDVGLGNTVRPLVQKLADGVGLTRTGRFSLALEAVDDGRIGDAREYVSAAVSSLDEPIPSMTTPADFGDDLTLAIICRASDDTQALDAVVDTARDRTNRNPGNDLVRAIATATQGIRANSSTQLLRAVEQMHRVERPLVVARMLEASGEIDPNTASATRSLERALRIYGDAGAARDASRILQMLRERGVRRRLQPSKDSATGLSLREQQVADHIAAGLTTKGIADALMVSPHTVVTHIRHIYAKWGLNTRREVAEHVRRSQA